MDKCHRKQPPLPEMAMVRVKTGGKSARVLSVMIVRGKPLWEQDKIGMCRLFVPVKHAGMSLRYMVATLSSDRDRIRLIDNLLFKTSNNHSRFL